MTLRDVFEGDIDLDRREAHCSVDKGGLDSAADGGVGPCYADRFRSLRQLFTGT